MKRASHDVYAVDLFCGAGGLTYGLLQAGVKVCLGVDTDSACKYPYTKNSGAKFLLAAVESLNAEDVEQAYPENGMRLLAGCAPCQTFSTYNQKATSSDERWWLLLQFARLVRAVLPDLVMTENVPRLYSTNVFHDFMCILHETQYYVHAEIVGCERYGVPQRRKRLIVLASRLGPIRLLSPGEVGAKPVTVRDAIGHLPPLSAGAIDREDALHRASALSELNRKRIEASKPGGTWRDWDYALVAKRHRKESGKRSPSICGRMHWDEPAPTLTTQFYKYGAGRYGHPEQDRALSLREGAILQTFPQHYEFVAPGRPIHITTVGKLIGNAVPPKLGQVIGMSILRHVAEQP